jgi:hypothetical protein
MQYGSPSPDCAQQSGNEWNRLLVTQQALEVLSATGGRGAQKYPDAFGKVRWCEWHNDCAPFS